jgi:hypothetical protein
MNSRSRSLLRVVLVAPLLALLAYPADAASWWGKRDNREGLVAMVRNRALLFQKDGPAKPCELNDAFQIGDKLKTYDASAARILFMEDSFLNIGPATEYSLTRSRYDEITGARDIGFGLAAGKVRLAVGRLFGRGSASVETPTAVVGVKGTDVIVGYNAKGKRTLVLVLQGEVELRSSNPQVSGIITTVSAGMFSEVGESTAPSEPQVAPEALIEANVGETTVEPDPERSTPEVTVAEAEAVPQPPPGEIGTEVTDMGLITQVQDAGDLGGGTSDPAVSQTGDNAGLNQPPPETLPPLVPPVTSYPPDQCPGCP